MSLRGASDKPYMPTMKQITTYATVAKGEKIPASFTGLFTDEKITTEAIPSKGRGYVLLTLAAEHNFAFTGANAQERDEARRAFEIGSQIIMKYGEKDVYVGNLATLLSYAPIRNFDGAGNVVTHRPLKQQIGILLYSPEAEAALAAAVDRGEVNPDDFARVGSMLTTKVVLDPLSRFSFEVISPQLDTDANGETHAIGKFVKANEYYAAFTLDVDNYEWKD